VDSATRWVHRGGVLLIGFATAALEGFLGLIVALLLTYEYEGVLCEQWLRDVTFLGLGRSDRRAAARDDLVAQRKASARRSETAHVVSQIPSDERKRCGRKRGFSALTFRGPLTPR
jgi:hypothetical protein